MATKNAATAGVAAASKLLSKEALDIIFKEARTFHKFKPQAVQDEMLKSIYDTLKWGPTAFNSSPGRVYFIKSQAAKERLYPTLLKGNIPQTQTAPVTAVLAWDNDFYKHFDKLSPSYDAGSYYKANPDQIPTAAKLNGTLMAGYFIIAARAHGLDCGPMSGFDNKALDEEFFKGTNIKSEILCNLGYGDAEGLFPRQPRFDFDEACKIL